MTNPADENGYKANKPRMMCGRHVGQIWRLADGCVGMIVGSGGEGGWFIQDTHDNRPFLLDYDSTVLVELITPEDTP